MESEHHQTTAMMSLDDFMSLFVHAHTCTKRTHMKCVQTNVRMRINQGIICGGSALSHTLPLGLPTMLCAGEAEGFGDALSARRPRRLSAGWRLRTPIGGETAFMI